VPLIFHSICDGCDPGGYSTSQATLQAFLDWLGPRSTNGTIVRTVAQVIGGPTTPPPASTTDTTAPSSSITCNDAACGTGWYTGPVSVALSATDASGVAVIRYTTDGSDPSAASPVYAAPFTVSATATVKFRAWDNANNVEATRSQLISLDSTAPVSSIACNGAPCSSAPYNAPVSVSLSATDASSGVAVIRYTTDGSDPTVESATYSAPFTVSATGTVTYRAWDNAGNVEATKSQLIQIDTTPADATAPTSAIACNGSACSSGWYAGAVSVSLSAVDSGGSGVAAIRYTTDGSDPTLSSPIFGGPFTVPATATVKYRAWDNAGNVETTKSQLIQIDTTAPLVTLTSPASGATVSGVVRLEATASDVGSGVARVEFYVDGKLEGTSTLLPYRVNWNTNGKKVAKGSHTIYVVVVDRAGNSRATSPITVTVA
jgi:hypothetical protein